MALTNPKIFGLKIGNKFTDVQNRRLVLRNLRIPEPDLDIIRGSQDASGSRGDFINFSRLTQPIYRTLDRYYEDSKVYDTVVIDRASISTILFGNLTINGRLDGSAIRYRYVDEKKLSVDSGNVNDTTDEITITGHGTNTEDNLRYVEGDTSIGGLANYTKYFVIKVDDNTIKLAATASDATAGNAINLTSSGSGTHTFVTQSEVKIADISTSRVSAWSSSDLRATSSDLSIQAKARISYGAQVRIRSSGSESILQFGTTELDVPGVSGKPRLQTSQIPQEREFDAEIPTHKIKIKTSASNTIELYAMKGIPLIFEGQFRNLSPRIRVIPLSGDIKPSWKIKEVNNPNSFINFADVLSGTYSQITFNSGSSRARFVQFYYPSDNIREIFLNSAGLTTLPVAKLSKLRRLELENNKISTLPNLNNFATSPTLFTTLNLRRNNLHLSEIPTERKLNAAVLDKIPSTVKFLVMGSTFYGSISDDSSITASDYSWHSENTQSGVANANASIIFQRFPKIQSLNLQRYGSKQFFHPDADDPECHIPNISDKCETYNIYRNNFRAIAGGESTAQTYNSVGNTGTDNGRSYLNAPTGDEKTIKTCTSLVNLQLSRNYNLTDESFGAPNAIASDNIKSIRMTFTNLPLPNVSNKPELEIIEANHTRNAGHIAFLSGGNEIYKFSNCNKLTQIYISNSVTQPQSGNSRPNGGLHGNFPTSFTNPELQIIRMENVRLEGGTPKDGGSGDTFPSTLFQNTPILREIRFSSAYFRKAGIGVQLFAFTPLIEVIRISSNKRITGNLPNIGSCSKLRYLDLRSNDFDGPVYSLVSNESLETLYLYDNKLTGDIPAYNNLPLMRRMKFNNNKFTKLFKFGLPNLQEFRCHINEITGTIPTFADCPKLKFLTLYSNKLSNYTPGALAENYSLRLADFSNNQLQQGAINNIVNDIYTNFENSGSSRSVLINLRNNPAQPSGDDVLEKIAELKKIGWQILT